MIGQIDNCTALYVGDINLLVAVAPRRECKSLSIRRPRRLRFGEWVVGDGSQIATIQVERIDIELTITHAGKGNPLSIGRPYRFAIIGVMFGQAAKITAIGAHHIEIPVVVASAREHNAISCGRPGWAAVGMRVGSEIHHTLASQIGAKDIECTALAAGSGKDDPPLAVLLHCARLGRDDAGSKDHNERQGYEPHNHRETSF